MFIDKVIELNPDKWCESFCDFMQRRFEQQELDELDEMALLAVIAKIKDVGKEAFELALNKPVQFKIVERKWQYLVVGGSHKEFIKDAICFLEVVADCHNKKLMDKAFFGFMEKMKPEYHTTEIKDLLKSYYHRGEDFLLSNMKTCEKSNPKSLRHMLQYCLKNDLGLSQREIDKRYDEINQKEIEKKLAEQEHYEAIHKNLLEVRCRDDYDKLKQEVIKCLEERFKNDKGLIKTFTAPYALDNLILYYIDNGTPFANID